MTLDGPSLDFFRSFLDPNSAQAVIEGVEPFRILHANSKWEQTCRFTNEFACGKTLRIIQGPKTDLSIARKLTDATRAGLPYSVVLTNYRSDGMPFCNFASVSAGITGPSGQRIVISTVQRIDQFTSPALGPPQEPSWQHQDFDKKLIVDQPANGATPTQSSTSSASTVSKADRGPLYGSGPMKQSLDEMPTRADVEKLFNVPLEAAARMSNMCVTTFKRLCRDRGISRWPYRKLKKEQMAAENGQSKTMFDGPPHTARHRPRRATCTTAVAPLHCTPSNMMACVQRPEVGMAPTGHVRDLASASMPIVYEAHPMADTQILLPQKVQWDGVIPNAGHRSSPDTSVRPVDEEERSKDGSKDGDSSPPSQDGSKDGDSSPPSNLSNDSQRLDGFETQSNNSKGSQDGSKDGDSSPPSQDGSKDGSPPSNLSNDSQRLDGFETQSNNSKGSQSQTSSNEDSNKNSSNDGSHGSRLDPNAVQQGDHKSLGLAAIDQFLRTSPESSTQTHRPGRMSTNEKAAEHSALCMAKLHAAHRLLSEVSSLVPSHGEHQFRKAIRTVGTLLTTVSAGGFVPRSQSSDSTTAPSSSLKSGSKKEGERASRSSSLKGGSKEEGEWARRKGKRARSEAKASAAEGERYLKARTDHASPAEHGAEAGCSIWGTCGK